MGFILNAGKKIGKGTAELGLGTLSTIGKTAMKTTGTVGNGVINTFNRNALGLIGATITGAAIGGELADMDGNVNPREAAIKGGAFTLGTIGTVAGVAGLASASTGAAVGVGMATAGTALGVAGLGAVMTGVKAAGQLGKSMVKVPDKSISVGLNNIGEFKLNGTAGVILTGAMAYKGIAEGVKTFEKSRMGVNDGMLRTATPIIPLQQNKTPSYANNAGATGDLVFSMFANR